ncbi:SdrD B-like domain-containing protein [Runella sp.]|uniref:SdrD B-like domain-containing protein n=1 Tax=Runella sp. TaxID=1960881 RepID=UPI003D0C45E6
MTVRVSLSGVTGTNTVSVALNGGTAKSVQFSSYYASPQEVAFEIDANGTGGTVSASRSGCTTVNTTYPGVAACPKTTCTTLGGIVFNDYNANGVRDVTTVNNITSGETNGIANVKIKATDIAGVVDSTLSDEYGYYTFTKAFTYPVRVEFVQIPSRYESTSTPNGSSSRTTVQFVAAASCNVHLGVNKITDYCNLSPSIFTTCYVNGNPLGGGTAGPDIALVSLPLDASGTAFGTTKSMWARADTMGSAWGLAYNRFTKKLFSAAVLRRHVGFGQLGVGGIYVTNTGVAAATTATSRFIDLDAAPFNLSLGTLTDNSTRGLPINKGIAGNTGQSRDPVAFTDVVKAGLGDLEISDNGDTLFTVNLHNQQLVIINIAAYNSDGVTKPTSATSISIPDPGCVNGNWRPWALKYYDGKLYIGGVCDAATGTKGNLSATVYRWDGGTTFTEIFDFPLTYPKGYPYSSYSTLTGWYPWTDDWDDFLTANTNDASIVYPQPYFADIEFDIDGSMILGFGDRTALQTGILNYRPDGSSTTQYSGFNGGDVLRAYAKNGVFVLENAGKAGPNTGYSTNNNQGPGYGEFYNDDWKLNNSLIHTESFLGALALRPGSGQTVATSIDPEDNVYWAGGFRLLNNNSGLRDDAFSVYSATQGNGSDGASAGELGKAAGLGDVELNCAIPTYLEIGNRVWLDKDGDGVQDPGEPGIGGVSVKLYLANAASLASPIATKTTSTAVGSVGEYYFSNSDGLLPNTAYVLVFGDGQQTAGKPNEITVSGAKYLLTKLNIGEGGALYKDLNDSDATLGTSVFADKITIPVTTGGVTADNHLEDMGVICIQPSAIHLSITDATCNNAQVGQNNGTIALTSAPTAADKFAVATGAVFSGFTYSTATAIGTTFPKNLKTAIPNAGATYTIRFYNGSDDCYKDTTIVMALVSCVKGSIGDLVWKDANDNGIQDLPSEKGVKGVIIQLLNSTNNAVLSTDTTDANGIYGFPNLASGSYKVKIVLSSLSDTCQISPKQDVNTGGGNDNNDSDFNPTTGESPVIVINTSGTGIAKDNPTIDAGLYVPCIKPVADADVTVCQGTLTVNLKDAGTGEVWSKGSQPANTSASINAATGVVTGLSSAGNYYFILTYKGQAACSDTVKVTINARPVANATAKKQTICVGNLPTAYTATPNSGVTYAWYGALADTTGSLGTAIGGATSATFTPSGAAITTPGTKYYAVVVTNTQTSCKDTAFVQLVVNAKPNAGNDITGGNAICNTIGTVDLPNAANGETWSQLGSTPKAVTINASTGVVTGMDVVGTYQFILKNATTGCADTLAVETKNCLKGSLGDFIWKDINDNGIQEQGEPGVKGVIVQLLNSTNNAVLATDTTDTAGIYSFTGLDSGNYKVKIVLSSLPDTCQITPKQDVNTGGGNDTNDSDFNPTTGESPVIVINTLATGIAKDNPTIDAGLIIPCVKPLWNFTTTPVCSPTATVYSVAFSIANKKGHLKVNAGTLSGSNPYTVTGIPNGTNLIITDSLRANCKYDTTIIAPDCSCPQVNLLTPNATACKGDTLPTLKITLIGANTNGVNVNWFANATGGNSLASGLSYKPAGSIAATDTFFVELSGGTGGCINQPRTAIIVTALDCQVDLALKKLINKKIAQLGDTLTYTVKVWNEFTSNATGVEVTDSIATTVQFVNGSFVASRGSATISGGVIKWTIGNIAANGDTVTLTYKVKAVQEGVHFNTAEISKTNEKDKDSTPGNGKDEEDDIDRQCFTVPVKLCYGEKVQVNIPAKYTNVQWFKDGGSTSVATGNQILFSEPGSYTFTANNNTCPAEGCCPVIIEPGDNCCPEDLCIPFTIKQSKKAGKKI